METRAAKQAEAAMQRSRGVRIRRGVIVNGIVCALLGAFVALVGAQQRNAGAARMETGRPTIAISPAPATRR